MELILTAPQFLAEVYASKMKTEKKLVSPSPNQNVNLLRKNCAHGKENVLNQVNMTISNIGITRRNISATCTSNADCESSPSHPICKETVNGGSRTCQSTKSCTTECLPAKFCDPANKCREIKKSKGIKFMKKKSTFG